MVVRKPRFILWPYMAIQKYELIMPYMAIQKYELIMPYMAIQKYELINAVNVRPEAVQGVSYNLFQIHLTFPVTILSVKLLLIYSQSFM